MIPPQDYLSSSLKEYRNLKFKTISGLILLFLSISIFDGIGIYQNNQIKAAVESIVSRDIDSIRDLDILRELVWQLRFQAANYALNTIENRDDARKRSAKLALDLESLIKHIDTEVSNSDHQMKNLKEYSNSYLAARARFFELIDLGKPDEALHYRQELLNPKGIQLVETINSLIEAQMKSSVQHFSQIQRLNTFLSEERLLFFGLVSVFIIVLTGFLLKSQNKARLSSLESYEKSDLLLAILKAEKSKLEAAESVAKMGNWELDLQTNQGSWSKGQLALLGLESLEPAPTFEMFLQYVHPEDRQLVQSYFQQILQAKQHTFEIEFRVQLGEAKTIRWMKERGALELNSEGQPVKLSGSIQDVTAEKLAEIDLRSAIRSLESLTNFLEQTGSMAKVGGWELDLATGQVHMSKQTLLLHEIDGTYTPPLYSTGAEWYPPEAWPEIRAAVQAAIDHGRPYDLESPFITAKGRRIWVRVQGIPVVKDGKVTGLSGTFQDITERKQLELENQFIAHNMGFGIWKYDPANGSLEWDQQMYALFGVNSKDLSGAFEAWENSLSPTAKEEAMKELQLALSGKKDFNTEFEIVLGNGQTRHIAGRAIVIRNEKNEPVRMIGINWDVTDRVRAEQDLRAANIQLIQSSKLASLGEMSSAIAHEINNPLAIIAGSARLLPQFMNNPEKLKTKLEAINKSCTRIEKIVTGLKKFSRSGDKTEFTRHSLGLIVEEAITITEAKSKRWSIPVSMTCSTEYLVWCNEIEIEQVCVNIISNAIDAARNQPEKWVEVSVFEDQESVVLRVTDSGAGIPERIRMKLFEPFFTTKTVGEGTGLGLSISKGILDTHGATISVVAECQNTCFEVRFSKIESVKNVA